MKIIIHGVYESYPVIIETEAIPKQLPGLVQELLDVGIAPPESLSQLRKSVDARGNRPLPTDHQSPTTTSAPSCPLHQSPMRAGQRGGYFCARKLPTGEWCDQKVTEKKAAHSADQPQQTSFVMEQPINQHGF
jgi:hypothetical protein